MSDNIAMDFLDRMLQEQEEQAQGRKRGRIGVADMPLERKRDRKESAHFYALVVDRRGTQGGKVMVLGPDLVDGALDTVDPPPCSYIRVWSRKLPMTGLVVELRGHVRIEDDAFVMTPLTLSVVPGLTTQDEKLWQPVFQAALRLMDCASFLEDFVDVYWKRRWWLALGCALDGTSLAREQSEVQLLPPKYPPGQVGTNEGKQFLRLEVKGVSVREDEANGEVVRRPVRVVLFVFEDALMDTFGLFQLSLFRMLAHVHLSQMRFCASVYLHENATEEMVESQKEATTPFADLLRDVSKPGSRSPPPVGVTVAASSLHVPFLAYIQAVGLPMQSRGLVQELMGHFVTENGLLPSERVARVDSFLANRGFLCLNPVGEVARQIVGEQWDKYVFYVLLPMILTEEQYTVVVSDATRSEELVRYWYLGGATPTGDWFAQNLATVTPAGSAGSLAVFAVHQKVVIEPAVLEPKAVSADTAEE